MVVDIASIGQQVGNYHLIEQLYSGSRTLVYRAVKKSTQSPVILKLSKHAYPSFQELLCLRNQYAIASNIISPYVIRPYSLELYQKSYILILEDFGGLSLKEYVKVHPPTLTTFLNIALKLAESLDVLYQHRVLHKDIKPANILINPTTQQVKLIDFSIASQLPREVQEIQSLNVLEGTLEYISPEQTGRMNRGIDYRSDFYSLGVTFFELLTGQLPFQSTDPLELVHCHIARKPPAVHALNPSVPLGLSAIIEKLMAKSADDRYQSTVGLKRDLNHCLQEWLEFGTIHSFRLGERDISDRFQIPEKLYGRQREVDALLDAFERVSLGGCELMLVAGFSGIGKTAVVNEVHKPIVQKRGYFVKGKYDQFQRDVPFSAVVQALQDLVAQLLGESDAQLAQWRSEILIALGDNGQVLLEVVPELEQIIGTQPPVPELSGDAAQNRFDLIFQKFIQVFATPEHPLVIFLDDLQWADLASLRLLQLLLIEAKPSSLLLIGAYRDNEVSPTHPLTLALETIRKHEVTTNAIVLAPLNQASINHLVADAFSTSVELAAPFSELVATKTKGNPFFITQFLYALNEDKLITFNYETGYWQCNLDQVRALTLADDVVEFMVTQLQKLPPKTQRVLRLAACIGNQFDLATLATIYERPQINTATDLWQTLQKGFIVPQTNVYKFFQDQLATEVISTEQPLYTSTYRFLHDRVQQAAYTLIPDAQKPATHLRIGQLLLKQETSIATSDRLFEIVNHFNIGADLLTEQLDRDELAQLNFAAGCKAKAATVYEAALNYFLQGIKLLSDQSWQVQYDLTLALYHKATESAYLSGNYEKVEDLAAIVLHNSRTFLDQVPIHEVRLYMMLAKHQFIDMIAYGQEVLAQLGIKLPSDPSPTDISTSFEKTQQLLSKFTLNELLQKPAMTDATALAAMRIMSLLLGALYTTNSSLFVPTGSKMIHLTLEKGNAPESPMGYTTFAVILMAMAAEVDKAYELGQLALQLLEQPQIKGDPIKTKFVVNVLVRPHKESIRGIIPGLLQGYQLSLEQGNLEYAGWYISEFGLSSFLSGEPLDSLQRDLERYVQYLLQQKQEMTCRQLSFIQQAILNLLGVEESSTPTVLMGSRSNEQTELLKLQETKDGIAVARAYLVKLMLSCLFPMHSTAEEERNCIDNLAANLAGVKGKLEIPNFYFYSSLAQLGRYGEMTEDQQTTLLSNVAVNLELLKQASHHAPENYAHKVALVEAEVQRVFDQPIAAVELYDQAIADAKANGFIQEEALANELAAKFYLSWNKQRIAQEYMIEAYYGYARWGAQAKLIDLETRYPELLAPILQSAAVSVTVRDTVTALGSNVRSSQSQLAENNVSVILDYANLLKASQTLSSEINLERLLSAVLKMVTESAGAQKGALILSRNGQLFVEAVLDIDAPEIARESIPLEESIHVPVNLIRTVYRTQETVVLFHAAVHPELNRDSYVQRHAPKSVLCSPILRHSQAIGVLYLENNLTTGAFTSDRVEILNLLCSQAAISLENARLYQQAQNALEDLRNAQLHIVQAEKMSSLGNLVAGIAHEINNPVNFIYGNLGHLDNYVRELSEYVQHCRTHSSQMPALEELAQQMDIEFLTEDTQKILKSMQMGTERIRQIVLSLRNFSRLDEADLKPVDIHEGIDNTLVILEHRLKARADRPAIAVIKEYGDLPEIECYAGQLNQVFMNILANAIDALEEKNQGRTFAEIQANPNTITIRTKVKQQYVQIHITDNGPGIPEAVQKKVFDPMFTTKPVGKGTGLGLSISRQIVTEKHNGTLMVDSAPGKGSKFVIMIPVNHQSLSK